MPSIKRTFCEKAVNQMQLREFFKKQLEGVGFADLEVQKTPLGTRVTVFAARPGLVIGKKGSNVKRLTDILARDFNLENPQIDVEEVRNPELNAQIMAERLANALERGQHYRRAGYGLLRRIMRAGAAGCEIVISGKITSQRARYQKMRQGIIKRCGEPVRDVRYGIAHAKLKTGVLGIRVKILPENFYNPKAIEYFGRSALSPELQQKLAADDEAIIEEREEMIGVSPAKAEMGEVQVEEGEVDLEDETADEEVKELAIKATERLRQKKKIIIEDEEILDEDEDILEEDDEVLNEDEDEDVLEEDKDDDE